jgi:hypothetical protein
LKEELDHWEYQHGDRAIKYKKMVVIDIGVEG